MKLEGKPIAQSNLVSAFPSFAYLEVSLSDKLQMQREGKQTYPGVAPGLLKVLHVKYMQ